ncbi:SgrR family transcriptional regulator [Bacillus sp. S/N-304-OC-R1]|uniref:SgrR family transcriptional regulator n=1 Tax=Bacillus sp. S/N-304-OC-R1 TaxID=2758034 RepID=UPI001C8E185A|nr:SgrR family transcriptional regulator [Bacillus sp. S/N-304-OC-R1]MBY0122114.1 SgrR family transcriptional regulator [Bacillus sp. S/N-304-OC-R1]
MITNIEEYYIMLKKQYHLAQEGEWVPITIDELSTLLCCTKRNTQLVVNKMRENGLIEWVPGKGRGNKSKLRFLQPISGLALQRAKQYVKEQKMVEAFRLIDEVQIIKYEFSEWLTQQFGFKNNEEKDILRYPFYRPVLRLDPTFVNRRTEANLVRQIFNTLVKYDVKKGLVIPQLAHFWESSDCKTFWRFYLRKGVRFHHGREMTSADIVFTFRRIISESPFESIKYMISDLIAVSKYVVEIRLREPNSLFLLHLCLESCSILPFDLKELNQNQSFEKTPIGTGPFRVNKNDESLLILEAYDYYFEGRPHLDGIEMWVWPDYKGDSHLLKPETNDIYFMDFEMKQDSLKQMTNIEQGATYLTFNLKKAGPLQDAHLRAAIHYGLDREKLIRELGRIREIPAVCFFPSSSQPFKNEYDLVRAKSYLAQSSYSGETIHLYTYEMKSNEENARWIANELREIGIDIQITILPITELSKHVVRGETDMVVAGEVFGDQVDLGMVEMFSLSHGYIHNHLGEEEERMVQYFLSLCKKEESSDMRMSYLIQLQQKLIEQNQILFLYHTRQTLQHSHLLNGVILNSWGKVDYQNIWIKR